MLTKSLKLRLKELDESGKFIGLSSVYGNRDYGGDVMVKGAFTKTLKDSGGKFPLLYGHKINVGVSYCEDTDEGLQTTGFLNLEKQVGKDLLSDMRFYKEHGLEFGMSIGYLPVSGKVEQKADGRYLKEVQLFENTLTEMPMNTRARVQELKELVLSHKADFTTELEVIETYAKRYQMMSALETALYTITWASDLTVEQKMSQLDETLSQFVQAYLGHMPKFFALTESPYKDAVSAIETKEAREIFNGSRITAAENSLRSLITSAEHKDAEPIAHSGVLAGVDRVLATIKSLAV